MRIVGDSIYAFDEEGVVVQLPDANFIPRQLELEYDRAMWGDLNKFNPIRHVINLEYINPTKESSKRVEVEVILDIYYTHAEKTSLEQGDFKLAYWDSESRTWISLDYEDHTPILSRGWAGFLRAPFVISGDPTIALGS